MGPVSHIILAELVYEAPFFDKCSGDQVEGQNDVYDQTGAGEVSSPEEHRYDKELGIAYFTVNTPGNKLIRSASGLSADPDHCQAKEIPCIDESEGKVTDCQGNYPDNCRNRDKDPVPL